MPNQNLENKISVREKGFNLKERLKKGAASLLIGASLMGLAGCATTGSYAESSNIGYEKFYDSYGDYKLVQKNNDVWMEKLDGSETKQITHTHDRRETNAFFGWQGKSIVYDEDWGGRGMLYSSDKYFIVKFEGDDSTRKEISPDEFVAVRDAGNK